MRRFDNKKLWQQGQEKINSNKEKLYRLNEEQSKEKIYLGNQIEKEEEFQEYIHYKEKNQLNQQGYYKDVSCEKQNPQVPYLSGVADSLNLKKSSQTSSKIKSDNLKDQKVELLPLSLGSIIPIRSNQVSSNPIQNQIDVKPKNLSESNTDQTLLNTINLADFKEKYHKILFCAKHSSYYNIIFYYRQVIEFWAQDVYHESAMEECKIDDYFIYAINHKIVERESKYSIDAIYFHEYYNQYERVFLQKFIYRERKEHRKINQDNEISFIFDINFDNIHLNHTILPNNLTSFICFSKYLLKIDRIDKMNYLLNSFKKIYIPPNDIYSQYEEKNKIFNLIKFLYADEFSMTNHITQILDLLSFISNKKAEISHIEIIIILLKIIDKNLQDIKIDKSNSDIILNLMLNEIDQSDTEYWFSILTHIDNRDDIIFPLIKLMNKEKPLIGLINKEKSSSLYKKFKILFLLKTSKLDLKHANKILSLNLDLEDKLQILERIFDENEKKLNKNEGYPDRILGISNPHGKLLSEENIGLKNTIEGFQSICKTEENLENKDSQIEIISLSKSIISKAFTCYYSLDKFCHYVNSVYKLQNNIFKSFIYRKYFRTHFKALVNTIMYFHELIQLAIIINLKIDELMKDYNLEIIINKLKERFEERILYKILKISSAKILEIKKHDFEKIQLKYPLEALEIFEDEIQSIEEIYSKEELMIWALHLYFNKIKNISIKEFYNNLDNIKTEGISERFCIMYFEYKININQGFKGLIEIKNLINTVKGRYSKSLKLLFEQFSQGYSSEDYRKFILKSPDKSSKWFFILANHKILYKINQELLTAIHQTIIKIYHDIQNQTLSVEEATSIIHHDEISRKEFIKYLTLALLIDFNKVLEDYRDKEKYKEEIEQHIYALTVKFEAIEYEKHQLNSFFCNILEKYCENYDSENKQLWEKYKNEYSSGILKFMTPGEKISNLKEIALQVIQVRSSKVFMKCFFKPKLIKKTYPLEDLTSILKTSYDEMKVYLSSTFSNLNKTRVVELRPILSSIAHAETEITHMKKFINITQEHQTLFIELQKFLGIESSMGKFCECVKLQCDYFEFSEAVKDAVPKSIEFIEKCINQIDSITCEDYLEITKRTYLLLVKDLDDEKIFNFIKITEAFADSYEYREFCLKITGEELENLKESVIDFEDVLVMTKDIIDFQMIVGFVQKVNKKRNFNALLKVYEDYLDHKDQNFSQKVEISVKKFQLNELQLPLKDQAKRLQIIQIYENSRVKLIQEHNLVEFILEYDMVRNYTIVNTFRYNSESLSELKDLAALMENNNEKVDEMKIMIQFIEFVNVLFSVLDTINKLKSLGYPNIVIPQNFIIISAGNFEELLRILDEFSGYLDNWEKSINSAYESSYLLTNCHGNQFWLLENYFRGEPCDQSKARTLLKFLQKEERDPCYYFNPSWSVEERLKGLGTYLENLANCRSISILDSNLERKFGGFITHENGMVLFVKYSNLLKGILSIFLLSGNKFPSSRQILYCSKNTTSVEVRSFVYRCFQDTRKRLYILVNNENLSPEIQTVFCYYFQKLIDDDFNKSACFGLLSLEDKSVIYNFFKYHKSLRFQQVKDREMRIMDDHLVRKLINSIDDKTTVITSAEAGFGKTFRAHSLAKKSSKEIIDYSISGEINLSSIVKDLLEINLKENKILLLNIGENNNIGLVNEVIMNLSMFRTLSSDTEVFILPDNLTFFIEVANTFDNLLYQSLEYLHYLRNEHISSFDLGNFQILEIDYKEINHVCNYLKLYKEGNLDQEEVNFHEPSSQIMLNQQAIVYHLESIIKETGKKN